MMEADALIEHADALIQLFEAQKPTPLYEGQGLQKICDSERWEEAGLIRSINRAAQHNNTGASSSATAPHSTAGTTPAGKSGQAVQQPPATPDSMSREEDQASSRATGQAPHATTAATAQPSAHTKPPSLPPAPTPAPHTRRVTGKDILRQAVQAAKVEQHEQLDWIDDLPAAPTTKVPPRAPRNP